jgi:hypothetical protein
MSGTLDVAPLSRADGGIVRSECSSETCRESGARVGRPSPQPRGVPPHGEE